MTKADLIILLPAFNEERNLISIIQTLETIFSRNQIFLADDGSTDRTRTVAQKLGIHIIRNPRNQGKGYILHQAFRVIIERFPKIKWIMTFDADGQHSVKDIPRFLELIEKAIETEIIIGRRDYKKMPPFNLVSNTLTTKWCNYWLKWNLHDLQCGFRCYKTTVLSKILNYGLSRNKFDFETEILLVAWFLDIKIQDIAIKTLYPLNHRKSHVVPSIDTFRWVILILKFGFSLKFLQKIWRIRYIKNHQRSSR